MVDELLEVYSGTKLHRDIEDLKRKSFEALYQ
jgi:hypothetical protein